MNPQLELIFHRPTYTVDQICETYLPMAERLRPYITETGLLLGELVDAGKRILFEGAQATLLDIDHGTYPYVTSSNCTAGGAVTGSGIGMKNVDRVLGIMKAYITRVGSGPMPTELAYETPEGRTLTEQGYEYGVTTGRRRRCGWFDGVIARYAARVNGLTDIALTKLDVLSEFDTIKLCVAYECNGVRYTTVPEHESAFAAAVPVYEEMPGWRGVDISGCRSFDELPEAGAELRAPHRGAGWHQGLVCVGRSGSRPDNRVRLGALRAFRRSLAPSPHGLSIPNASPKIVNEHATSPRIGVRL